MLVVGWLYISTREISRANKVTGRSFRLVNVGKMTVISLVKIDSVLLQPQLSILIGVCAFNYTTQHESFALMPMQGGSVLIL